MTSSYFLSSYFTLTFVNICDLLYFLYFLLVRTSYLPKKYDHLQGKNKQANKKTPLLSRLDGEAAQKDWNSGLKEFSYFYLQSKNLKFIFCFRTP